MEIFLTFPGLPPNPGMAQGILSKAGMGGQGARDVLARPKDSFETRYTLLICIPGVY